MSSSEDNWSRRVIWIGLLLFLLALGLRVLFLHATPATAGPHNPYYKGDTPYWLDHAKAIQSSRPVDLGLPLRPPGVAYLVALLWNGRDSGLFFLGLVWCFVGATTVGLLFLAALRSFDFRVAAVTAIVASASTGLILLSTSINNETPYLLLVIASFALWEPIRHRPGLRTVTFWSILHGGACLIRVEHVLFFVLISAYLTWAWAGFRLDGAWRRSLRRAGLMWALFVLTLIPWHMHAWSEIERLNEDPLPMNTATEQVYLQVEQALEEL